MRAWVVALVLGCSSRPEPAPPPPPQAPADWVPAEFKKGRDRWKDTVVYVDGTPVGVLAFGELPVALEPVWIEDTVSAPRKPGATGPAFTHASQRHYRFVDYLRAVGVEPRRLRELHVMGPKASETLVVTGAELERRGEGLLFRFGGEVRGKAIPVVPARLGNGRAPDKITSVMAYLDREPPLVVRNQGLVLAGELVRDVPYYGEPLRGGVRVYVDDRLAAVIKRRALEDVGKSGEASWGLLAFLEAQGVDTSGIVEAWVVRGARRRERFDRAQLAELTFEASPQGRGRILVGPARAPAHALALHSRPVAPERLPRLRPHEE